MDVGSTPRERSHGKIPAHSVGELLSTRQSCSTVKPGSAEEKQLVSQCSRIQRYGDARCRKHAGWPQNRVCVTSVASTFTARLHGHLSPWLTPDKRSVVSVSSWQLCVRDIGSRGSVGIHGLSSSLCTHRHDVRHGTVTLSECGVEEVERLANGPRNAQGTDQVPAG